MKRVSLSASPLHKTIKVCMRIYNILCCSLAAPCSSNQLTTCVGYCSCQFSVAHAAHSCKEDGHLDPKFLRNRCLDCFLHLPQTLAAAKLFYRSLLFSLQICLLFGALMLLRASVLFRSAACTKSFLALLLFTSFTVPKVLLLPADRRIVSATTRRTLNRFMYHSGLTYLPTVSNSVARSDPAPKVVGLIVL